MPTEIFDRLRHEVEAVIQQDGIKGHKPPDDDGIDYPKETVEDVTRRAIDTVYYDVAGFYDWLFNLSDPRYDHAEPVAGGSDASLKAAVEAVVEDNLDAMLDADEIDQTTLDGLDKGLLTDKLVGYIENWQDWYWKRKALEDLENAIDQQIQDEEIFSEGDDYGEETAD